jgi:hypothetical protein
MSLHNRNAVTPIFARLAEVAWGLVALLIFANVAARINTFAALTSERYKMSEPRHPSRVQNLAPELSPAPDIKLEAPLAAQPGTARLPEIGGTIAPAQQSPEPVPEVRGTLAPAQPSGDPGLNDQQAITTGRHGSRPAFEVRETIVPVQPGADGPSATLKTIAPTQSRARPARETVGTIATHAARAEAKRNMKPVTRGPQPAEKQTPSADDGTSLTKY